ncbi:rhodanese-like domain-containing protein [Eubacteriales bacterium OttesenSCG-928-A19]|nr:rhodanese-like domain-containing protein [Eubacteriales bacterium OttesenSCG-928-A19]
MLGFFSKQDINKGVNEYNATNGAVLLDVRTRDEYRSGHVPGSMHIDVAEIHAAATAIPDKTTPLFVYCQSGSRSGMAVNALKKMGFTNVKNIGGIMSYSGSVEKGD